MILVWFVNYDLRREELQSIARAVASWGLFVTLCGSFVYLRVIRYHDQFLCAQNLSNTFLCFWCFSFRDYLDTITLLIKCVQHICKLVAFLELLAHQLIRYLILWIFGCDQFEMQLLGLYDINVLIWCGNISDLVSILTNLFQGPPSNFLWSLKKFLYLSVLLLICGILDRIRVICLYH